MTGSDTFLLGLVVVTSLLGYAAGRRALGLDPRELPAAAGRVLECLGLAALFFAGNLGLGITAVLAARVIAGGGVSLYVLDDVVLLGLSLLQALVFAWWRRPGERKKS